MKTTLQLLSLLLLVCTLSYSGEENAPVLVETVKAVRSDSVVNELQLTGTIVSQRSSRLSSRTGGLVEEVKVDAGSQVKQGDVLLTLDTRIAEIELELIRAEIETVTIQLRDAERRHQEVTGLTDSGAFSRSEAISREATSKIRATELKALKVREEQQLENIERHSLVAPFSGSIARKTTEAGEWVETGTTVLELVETDSLWFELQVAQEFLPAIRNVDGAILVLDAYQDNELTAKIDVIVPVKDPVSRTFTTRLLVEDPDSLASPGMSGTAILRYRPARSSNISIPRDAVTRYPDGSATVWTVQTVDGKQVAHSVSVSTTGDLGENVEVSDGLKGGEQVVVRGNEGLSEGDEVEARERSAEIPPASL